MALEQVPVGLQRRPDVLVPQLGLDLLRSDTLGYQQRDAGVPELVDGQPLSPAASVAGIHTRERKLRERIGSPRGDVNTRSSRPRPPHMAASGPTSEDGIPIERTRPMFDDRSFVRILEPQAVTP